LGNHQSSDTAKQQTCKNSERQIHLRDLFAAQQATLWLDCGESVAAIFKLSGSEVLFFLFCMARILLNIWKNVLIRGGPE
jgi:hypothetical protein